MATHVQIRPGFQTEASDLPGMLLQWPAQSRGLD